MFTCLTCNNSLIKGYYQCTESDYRVVDENYNLIYIKATHDLDKNYEEVNTESELVYCNTCNTIIDYPTTYDSTNNVFKNGESVVTEYYDYLNKNIIHQFTNINCKYCNNILEKGYFSNTETEQTEENLLRYSYPNDFPNTIHIYNESSNTKIKDIITNNYELQTPSTDIGKKLIYCPSCNFFITNKLQEIYK